MDLFAELTLLIGEMQRRQVEYAICGGIALAVHGVPRATLAAGRPQDIADVQKLTEASRG